MKLKKAYLLKTVVIILLIIPFAILFFLSPREIKEYTKEDGIIENLTAVFYIIASIICIITFYKSKSAEKIYFLQMKRNSFFLLLGLFFFICFGEEISWGQRLFDFHSSKWFIAHNIQKETNLHNLNIFEPFYKVNIGKTQLDYEGWSIIEGLFLLIWFFFCFVIPIINRLSSKVNIFIKKIYFPVVPMWIGVFFVFHQIIYELAKSLNLLPFYRVSEIKEANIAFLFLIVSISFYKNYYYNLKIRNF